MRSETKNESNEKAINPGFQQAEPGELDEAALLGISGGRKQGATRLCDPTGRFGLPDAL